VVISIIIKTATGNPGGFVVIEIRGGVLVVIT